MDTEKRELWDRLDNEFERAHRAFRAFLNLPSGERTVVEAYRGHVGNPQAVKPSDTWTRWSRDEGRDERQLLEAIDRHGEITPVRAALETSLTVAEADRMLSNLAQGGHLEVRVKEGKLLYSL
jgi:hypothetical protein